MPVGPLNTEFLIRFGVLLAALTAASVFVYWPGLTGPLLFDDYINLSPLGEDGGVSSWSNFKAFVFGNPSGPTGRPVSMLSFLIDAQNWPPHIASFKYTNILIHVLCGLMLCWLAIELFQILGVTQQRSAMLGLLVAALWLLHPLNGSTTLYVIQRMTQLMTLFALASLLCYLKGRQRILSNPSSGFLLLCLCLFPFALLSVLSKENGALILFLIVAFELSVFRSTLRNSALLLWFRVGVLVPIAVFVCYLLFTLPDALAGYEFRHFDLFERLLTQARILSIYLSQIFLPLGAGVSLFHDDIPISSSLISPLSTAFSIAFLGVAGGIGLYVRKTEPVLFLGIAWFFSMHVLESSYMPLELYFEHRNYMSMIGPIIACVWYLDRLLLSAHAVYFKRAGIAVFALFLVITPLLTWQHSILWGHTGNLYAYWAENQPESSRAQISYADFLSANGFPEESLARLRQAHELNPREITTLLHMWNRACEFGLTAPYSLAEIQQMDDLEFFHNNVSFHLTTLVENLLLNKCSYPDSQTMVALFDRVGELSLSTERAASYHFLYSDLFVHYRQLNPALIQLRAAFDMVPSPHIPIRQAMLSASAGNNADALVFLERARAADRERSMLLPSFEEEIARIEADIKARIASQQ